MSPVKLVTFQSWTHQPRWWQYHRVNKDIIPFPLIDRSPCQDPFLDQYKRPDEARPLISGLCRSWKNFEEGQIFIYVSKAHPRVLNEINLEPSGDGNYFAVACLQVLRVWDSHEEFAESCVPRQYISRPPETAAPPNVVIDRRMANALDREGCILFDEKGAPHLGGDVSESFYRANLNAYRARERKARLRVAECRFLKLKNGDYSRRLTVEEARLLSPSDWARFIHADNPSFMHRIYGHDVEPGSLGDLVEVCFGSRPVNAQL